MKLYVLSVLGAVLVHNSAAEDPAGDVPDNDIYTYSDDVRHRFTPEATTPQPRVDDKDLVMDMLLAKDGEKRRRVARSPDAQNPPSDPEPPSIDPKDPDTGYFCAQFNGPALYGLLGVLNATAFLLQHVWTVPPLFNGHLEVTFKGPNLVKPINFTLKAYDALSLGSQRFVMDPKQVLSNLDEVTVDDSFKRFSASLNISQCRTSPPPLPRFENNKNGVTSGGILKSVGGFFKIKNFTYPGNCPAAFLWAGTGGKPDGFKLPIFDSRNKNPWSKEPLLFYKNEDVMFSLPGSTSLEDLDYIGVNCPANGQMLARHVFKPSI